MDYSGIMISEPQTEEGITKVSWLSADDISGIKGLAWMSLADLINTYILKV